METLEDQILKSQLFLERLKPESLEELIKRVDKAEAKIIQSILSTSRMTDKARFIELKKIIAEQIAIAYEPYTTLVFEDMERIAELAYNSTNNILNVVAVAEGFKKAVGFDNLSDSAIKRMLDPNRPILGRNLPDTQKFLTTSQTDRIRSSVISGLVNGEGLATTQRNALAVESMQDEFSKIKRNDLKTLTRTAMLQAIDDSRYETFRQHSTLIQGWTYTATLDNRTSFICASLDGTFYPISKYPDIDLVPQKPKLHYNCRSLLIPETKTSLEDVGTRPFSIQDGRKVNHRDGTTSTKFKVEKAGQVKGSTRFPNWFSKQSATFQREYLGPSRYSLYKQNKLTFDLLVGAKNQPLTLDQIQAKL